MCELKRTWTLWTCSLIIQWTHLDGCTARLYQAGNGDKVYEGQFRQDKMDGDGLPHCSLLFVSSCSSYTLGIFPNFCYQQQGLLPARVSLREWPIAIPASLMQLDQGCQGEPAFVVFRECKSFSCQHELTHTHLTWSHLLFCGLVCFRHPSH